MADVKDNKPSAGLESYLEPPTPKPAEREKSVFSGLRVSLMPTELAGAAAMDPRRAIMILVVVLIAETVLLGVAYLALMKVTGDREATMESNKSEFAALKAQTKTLESQASLASQFSAQYEANQISLDQHLYWTQLLANLEKFILPNVQCTSFSSDATTGTVNLDCHGRNFRDVAEQIVYMRTNPNLMELRTSSASAEMDKEGKPLNTSFAMNMKFKLSSWHAVEKGKMPVTNAGSTPTSQVAPSVPSITDAPVELETLKPATTASTP